MLNSDGQKVPPCGDFREFHNFYIYKFVFDVQIVLLKVWCQTSKLEQAANRFFNLTCAVYVIQL